jgi:hypothetical protein
MLDRMAWIARGFFCASNWLAQRLKVSTYAQSAQAFWDMGGRKHA